MTLIVIWFILCFIVAAIAETRTVGFWGGFLWSFFLSPIIGLIIALCSKTNTQAAIEQGLLNQLQQSNKKSPEEIETKLKKIQEMKDSNLISESEFKLMRKEVMGS